MYRKKLYLIVGHTEEEILLLKEEVYFPFFALRYCLVIICLKQNCIKIISIKISEKRMINLKKGMLKMHH